jgi:hypothetical protein
MEAFDAAGVTGIIWRRVLVGKEPQAEAVMRELMLLSREAEGFLGSEIFPPVPGVQDAYVVLYRFSRGTHLRQWLACTRRQELLREIDGLLAAPALEFFFTHGRKPAGSASSVFAYRIRPGKEEDFQDWRRRILEAARMWKGFLGTESFDALDGLEPEFIVVVRFDSRANLDAWLKSKIRDDFMKEVRAYVHHYTLRRISSGFEGWFDTTENTAPPARWRQALVILSALFPVIMTMRQLLSPIFLILPLPAAFLILLALDMAILTYVVMPHYSRMMNFWLRPAGDFTWRGELAGCAIVAGVIALTLVGFLIL